MGGRGSGGGGPQGPQMQFGMMVPVTPVVRWLIGICVGVWLILQSILEGFVLSKPYITQVLSLVPELFLTKFFLWQPLTYMFLHSQNLFHILFNMLLLWWLGAELEQRWGSRFFLIYYLATGIGAGIIYGVILAIQTAIFGTSGAWLTPVVGASGAIFGLMLAYGIIFGERVVYFMMVFPMRAKYFVMILGAVEVVTLLNNGTSGNVANLAHLGGIASGFLFLQGYTRFQQSRWRKQSDKRGRGLKLVVNNDKKDEKGGGGGGGPKYWN